MYKYKIGYTSYEESSFAELEHEKQFTREEIRDMVAEATVDNIKKLKAMPNEYTHSFKTIFSGDYENNTLADSLISLFGFKRIEYEQHFSVFGWPSIFYKNDWANDRDEDLDYITDKVRAAGFTEKDDTYWQHQQEIEEDYKKEHPEEFKDKV